MAPADNSQTCGPGYYMDKNETPPCTPCPSNQYSAENNTLNYCQMCNTCSSDSHLRLKRNCDPTQDALCECQERYYCTDDGCSHCTERTECPPGQGVVNPGARENTKCEPCPKGLFSNVTDYHSPCTPHTNCTGRGFKWEGNATTDSVCNPPIEPRSTQCPTLTHAWMLPAGLWVGLIVSAIVFIIYVYWKTRRQSQRTCTYTVSDTEEHGGNISPALAPDILPPPLDLKDLKDYKDEATETQLLSSAVETSFSSMPCMCTVECDGVASPTVTSPTSPMRLHPLAVACGQAGESIGSSMCQSEPQEDEWPTFSSSVNLAEGKLCV